MTEPIPIPAPAAPPKADQLARLYERRGECNVLLQQARDRVAEATKEAEMLAQMHQKLSKKIKELE